MKNFAGVYTALITPFKNGEIDFASVKRVLRAQLDGGISGLVVNGTTGESPTLAASEKQKLFSFIRAEVSGSVPLIMGTGSNSTSETILATQDAEKAGADAALVVVPYYNKPPQRGLFQHFQKVAQNSSLPIILYNVPSRTITKLELQTIIDLSEIDNIVGIKEASGDIEFGSRIVRECKDGFLVTSGDDGTFLSLMAVGGRGVISVASNIMPKLFSRWCARALTGETEPQLEFQKYNELNSYLYTEANPIPIKMAMYHLGLIDSPELRLPLVQFSEPYAAELKRKMQSAGLL